MSTGSRFKLETHSESSGTRGGLDLVKLSCYVSYLTKNWEMQKFLYHLDILEIPN